MWQRLTKGARLITFFAGEAAAQTGVREVSTEHFLLGILRENDTVAAQVFIRLGVKSDLLRSGIDLPTATGRTPARKDMGLSKSGKRLIDAAYAESRRLNNNYIGSEHLLLGVIGEAKGVTAVVLQQHGVTRDRVFHEIKTIQSLGGRDGVFGVFQADDGSVWPPPPRIPPPEFGQ